MSGAPITLLDLLDLGILFLAKIKRPKRQDGSDDKGFYEAFFTDFDDSVFGARGDPRKNVRLDVVCGALAEFVPKGAILDVGCGLGDTLDRLTDFKRWTLYGAEYAAPSARRAQARLDGRATICTASATALPFPDATFDGLTCIEVLEHIEDDRAALNELWRVLRPSGCAVVTVPYRHWFPQYRTLIGHHRHYTRAALEQQAALARFRVERWLANFPRWHRAADLVYVAAKSLAVVARLVGGRECGPDEVRLLFQREPVIGLALRRIEFLKRADARIPPEARETTTSCVLRKIEG
jgi:SAM-dependent methyltransferase